MEQCVVCLKSNNAFNYGISSCNACTMFYRRALVAKKLFYPCCNQGKCYKEIPFKLQCRMCRFEKCVKSGIKTIHSTTNNSLIRVDTSSTLPSLLADLKHRDEIHMNVYLNSIPASDVNPRVEDVIRNSNSVLLIAKPVNHQMTLDQWSILCQFVNIELIKKCDFVKLLSPADQFILINSVKMLFIFFKFAAAAKFEKKGEILFPGGIDFLPVSTGLPFERNFRYQMLGRVIELDVSREEFLLVGMILLCNPTVTGLSEYASTVITSYQKKFTSSLFEHCRATYQSEGPSRFTDLLSLFHVFGRVLKDMEAYNFWVRYKFPHIETKKIVSDSFETSKNQ